MRLLVRYFPYFRAFAIGFVLSGACASICAAIGIATLQDSQSQRQRIQKAFNSQAVELLTSQQDSIDQLEAKMKAQQAEINRLKSNKP